MALTLVPQALAREGYRFHYVGANAGPECEACPLQKLCFGLQPGHTYQVQKLRQVTHPCNLHEEGRVRVVEVEPTSIETSVESRRLLGTAVTWRPIGCERPECPSYGLCHPVGPAPDTSYEIVETGEAMSCPADYHLRRVRLRRMG